MILSLALTAALSVAAPTPGVADPARSSAPKVTQQIELAEGGGAMRVTYVGARFPIADDARLLEAAVAGGGVPTDE